MNKRTLVWIRNEFRIHDNELINKAIKNSDDVIFVYFLCPSLFLENSLGFKNCGALRLNFIMESVQDFKSSIEALGGTFLFQIGNPVDGIEKLVETFAIKRIIAQKEDATYEKNDQNELESRIAKYNAELQLVWGSTLYHLDDLQFPLKNLPDMFTAFRKKTENYVNVREVLESPTSLKPFSKDTSYINHEIPTLKSLGYEEITKDSRSVLEHKGGEKAAIQRLNTYFWKKDLLKTYKETRNGLIGTDYSSKLSVYLSNGCISPRFIYNEVMEYEDQRGANESTYWLVFELLWRDFFRFTARKYGDTIFKKYGIIPNKKLEFKQDMDLFTKWINGQTGIPFIDANMIELKETGFMSNRGRQNVASFLVKDLGIDWRWGASYFESQLIDYDVYSNWLNWLYIAGNGNDPRSDRYFNIMTQAERYDPCGEYIKLWIPALKPIPKEFIQYPGKMSEGLQIKLGMELGKNYPVPVFGLDYFKGK